MRRLLGVLLPLVALLAAPAPAPALAAQSHPAQSHSERILFDGGGESLNGVTYHS